MQSLQSSVLWSSKVTVFKMPLKQQNSVLGPSGTTAGHHAPSLASSLRQNTSSDVCLVRMLSRLPRVWGWGAGGGSSLDQYHQQWLQLKP